MSDFANGHLFSEALVTADGFACEQYSSATDALHLGRSRIPKVLDDRQHLLYNGLPFLIKLKVLAHAGLVLFFERIDRQEAFRVKEG